MAQVILSSVGQSIGGPIGSAIGSTIGRARPWPVCSGGRGSPGR
jgi:hypothetical protein